MRFKLLTTTAIFAIGWLAGATAPAISGSMNDAVHEKNREFLKNYGYRIYVRANCYSSHCNGSSYFAATPIFGNGESVHEIDEAYTAFSSASATVLLFSSANGVPGNYLSGASHTFLEGSGKARIPISPTYLEKGKKYWIVDELIIPSVSDSSVSHSVMWLYDNNHMNGALYRYNRYSDHNDRSGWKKVRGGRPYAKVR